MAVNEKFHDGDVLSLPVPAYAVSGSAVQVLGLVGVCLTGRRADGTATVKTKGVFEMSVTGITAVGTPIFVTTATGALVVAAGVGVNLIGHALTVKAGAGAGPVLVRLVPYAVSTDTLA